MTPLQHDPNNVAGNGYNFRLKAARQVTERVLGILREKYPCFNHLRLSPTYVASVVKCCATLCNFSREEGEDNIILTSEEVDELSHVNVRNEQDVEEQTTKCTWEVD
ncbi:hypothetical protein PR048_027580 [Dryococelus australis]|uniref:DDE Tnp4 domain-containing protein n=1 Tax=Dryococelus australis TaxID=614101 RepID=A0ABQ9GGX7_9NEOP|nr:hypothetical protein PR048_027580 [Dryococelus australis]